LIQRIEDGQGNIISQAAPIEAGKGAEQVLDVRMPSPWST